jgi:hypothetical protein
MIDLKRIPAIATFVAFQMVCVTNAYAACKKDPVLWEFGQAIDTIWITDTSSVCTSIHWYPENIEKIQIIAKPKHGVAGTNGPFGVAYKPQSGFHGSDKFSYSVTSNKNYKGGAGRIARITVLVTVQ